MTTNTTNTAAMRCAGCGGRADVRTGAWQTSGPSVRHVTQAVWCVACWGRAVTALRAVGLLPSDADDAS